MEIDSPFSFHGFSKSFAVNNDPLLFWYQFVNTLALLSIETMPHPMNKRSFWNFQTRSTSPPFQLGLFGPNWARCSLKLWEESGASGNLALYSTNSIDDRSIENQGYFIFVFWLSSFPYYGRMEQVLSIFACAPELVIFIFFFGMFNGRWVIMLFSIQAKISFLPLVSFLSSLHERALGSSNCICFQHFSSLFVIINVPSFSLVFPFSSFP